MDLWTYDHYNNSLYSPTNRFPIITTMAHSLNISNYYNQLTNDSFFNYDGLRITTSVVFKMVTDKLLSIIPSNVSRVAHISGVVCNIQRAYADAADTERMTPDGPRRVINVYYVYRDINNVFDYLDTELGRYSSEHPTGDMLSLSVGFKEDRYHRVRIYKTRSATYVFTTHRMSAQFVRRLYTIVPVLFDDIFPADNELAVNVFRNIMDTCEDWLESVKAWVDENLDEAKITADEIRRVFGEAFQAQKNNINNVIARLRRDLENALVTYTRTLKDLEAQNALYQRLYDSTSATEMMDEFLNFIIEKEKESCKLTKVGNRLRLDIVAPLTNYSVAEANNIIRRQINDPTLKQLMQDIFVEQKYTLYMSTSMYWDIMACYQGNNPIQAERHGTYCTKGVPNPHHYYFSCYGDNTPATVKAMQNGQYIAAYLQLKASVGSFNWTDCPVASSFLSAIRNTEEHYWNAADAIKDNETDQLYSFKELYNKYLEGANEA